MLSSDFAKPSLLVFYLHLSPDRAFRITVKVIGLCFIAYAVIYAFTSILRCQPHQSTSTRDVLSCGIHCNRLHGCDYLARSPPNHRASPSLKASEGIVIVPVRNGWIVCYCLAVLLFFSFSLSAHTGKALLIPCPVSSSSPSTTVSLPLSYSTATITPGVSRMSYHGCTASSTDASSVRQPARSSPSLCDTCHRSSVPPLGTPKEVQQARVTSSHEGPESRRDYLRSAGDSLIRMSLIHKTIWTRPRRAAVAMPTRRSCGPGWSGKETRFVHPSSADFESYVNGHRSAIQE